MRCLLVSLLVSTSFKVHNKLPESPSANEILDILFQLKVVFGILTMVSLISTILSAILLAGVWPHGVGSFKDYYAFPPGLIFHFEWLSGGCITWIHSSFPCLGLTWAVLLEKVWRGFFRLFGPLVCWNEYLQCNIGPLQWYSFGILPLGLTKTWASFWKSPI